MEKLKAAWPISWRVTSPLRTVTGIFLGLVISMTFFLLLTDSNLLSMDVVGLPAVAPSSGLPAPVALSRHLSANTASGGSAGVVTTPAAGQCREGLYGMLNGHWEPKPMTAKDVEKMNAFHRHVVALSMPQGVQREDLKCGNFTINKGFFRALCDPDGPTPCCYKNTCVNRTVEECECPQCMDMRGGKHAEYSNWRTTDPSCQPLNFTQQAMCELLDGGTVYTIGDSFVRHVHTAMVLMIRNNEETGAFSEDMPKDVQKQCRNIYMFTEKVCRNHLAMDVSACQGRVRVRHILGNYNSDGPEILDEISGLKNKPRSVVYIGLGIHGTFNSKDTFNEVMKPVLERMRRENWEWPVIIWASTHSFGMLKSPMFDHQRNPEVERFNGEMEEWLKPYTLSSFYQVYIYNAFNLTAGVTSFDGAHYGMGVNKVKVNILMNFIHSLKEKKLWR